MPPAPRRVACAAAMLVLGACAGVERQGPDPGDAAIVSIQGDSLSVQLDFTVPVLAERTDAAGNPRPGRIQWRTGNGAVATVDSTGRVTAVGVGRTWVEASDRVHTDTLVLRTYVRFGTIHAGEDVTCGLSTGGRALCWGTNAFGSIGDGLTFDRHQPAMVEGDRRYGSMTVGAGSVCATADGLYCWGYNGVGQLGDGTIAQHRRPVRIADTLELDGVTLGAGTTTCAFERSTSAPPIRSLLIGDASLLCWGWNGYGQLLDGGGANSRRPKRLDAGRPLPTIVPGGHHVCGLDEIGAAWCWGRNDEGQLGNGSNLPRLQPVAVEGNHVFASLAAGIMHTCALTATGQAWCWGDNAWEQLAVAGSTTVPSLAAGGMTFEMLATSANHTCGIATGGAAWCWGANASGQLGTGSSSPSAAPALVSGNLSFASISAGRRHTCGIATDGYAYCWGENASGQLGTGQSTPALVPTRVAHQ